MRAGPESDTVGVLDRMTAILEAFDEDDHGLRISELAARADLPKSTVSRLVSTLVREHTWSATERSSISVFGCSSSASSPTSRAS